MSEWVTVRTGELHDALVQYLSGEGLTASDAECVAGYLVDTERSGVHTHGIAHLRGYIRLIRAKTIEANPDLRVVHRSGAALTLHGGNGLGQVVGTWMMREAAEQVRQSGVAVVTVRAANHLGALGYYFRLPGLETMGGMLTQVTAPIMVSAGAMEPRLGNNPVAMSMPSGPGRDRLVLDISCSQTSGTRVRQAMQRGPDTPVPPTWALGPDGQPARTAAEAVAGALLPMAGHKGAGLATIMGAMAGVLSGGAFGDEVVIPAKAVQPRDIGYFLVLFDVGALMDLDEYGNRMDTYVDYLAGARTADGEPVRMPGERSAAERSAAVEEINLVADQWTDLVAQLESADVAVPEPV